MSCSWLFGVAQQSPDPSVLSHYSCCTPRSSNPTAPICLHVALPLRLMYEAPAD